MYQKILRSSLKLTRRMDRSTVVWNWHSILQSSLGCRIRSIPSAAAQSSPSGVRALVGNLTVK